MKKKLTIIIILLIALGTIAALAMPKLFHNNITVMNNDNPIELQLDKGSNTITTSKEIPLKLYPDKDNNMIIEDVNEDDTICKRLWLLTWNGSADFKGDEPVYAVMDDRSLKKIGKIDDIYNKGDIKYENTPIDNLMENYYWITVEPPKGVVKITVVAENLKGERTIKTFLLGSYIKN